ncbi:MAG TPA: ion channel DMI1 [Thermoanaerobaculia bacterium]
MRRLRDRFKFEIERLILRGPVSRMLVIALTIVLISVGAGWIVFELTGRFPRLAEAVWWAFLRLTDPGYLGDDEGNVLRVVSTIVTILGYVVFLGALIAIMTQWLNATLHRLQQGLTPIAQNDHIVILGWTNRTATIIEELILSEERVRRFLRLHQARRLRMAVLIEDLRPEIVHELRERLGPLWDYRKIIFRSGTPLRLDHLDRVDFANAAAILLPFPDFARDNTFARDERTIKTLLSIDSAARQKKRGGMPQVVVEVLDGRNVSLARRAYSGPLQILASDLLVSRLIAQNIRHAGLSGVFSELLTHSEGNEIYVRDAAELAGATCGQLRDAFPDAVFLGLLRKGETPLLNPSETQRAEAGDRLILAATSYARTAPLRALLPARTIPRAAANPLPAKPLRRILLLGWNHKVPALIAELGTYRGERFEIDLVSLVSTSERETLFHRYGVDASGQAVRHVEADFTSMTDLTALEPSRYDNVVILASEWKESEVESDARTILGFLMLEELLSTAENRPEVLVELMDQENVPLLRGRADVLISPLLLSHMLTQVALRPDLRQVFDEIFGPGGAEIFLRPASDVIRAGERVTFQELADRLHSAGEIALGLRGRDGSLSLNPPKDSVWTPGPGDELVVLTQT